MNDDPHLTSLIIGITVKADHPITCLNPSETFKIAHARIDNDQLYCRGEKTMWFSAALLTRVEEPTEESASYKTVDSVTK
jgi:hypothetical protein